MINFLNDYIDHINGSASPSTPKLPLLNWNLSSPSSIALERVIENESSLLTPNSLKESFYNSKIQKLLCEKVSLRKQITEKENEITILSSLMDVAKEDRKRSDEEVASLSQEIEKQKEFLEKNFLQEKAFNEQISSMEKQILVLQTTHSAEISHLQSILKHMKVTGTSPPNTTTTLVEAPKVEKKEIHCNRMGFFPCLSQGEVHCPGVEYSVSNKGKKKDEAPLSFSPKEKSNQGVKRLVKSGGWSGRCEETLDMNIRLCSVIQQRTGLYKENTQLKAKNATLNKCNVELLEGNKKLMRRIKKMEKDMQELRMKEAWLSTKNQRIDPTAEKWRERGNVTDKEGSCLNSRVTIGRVNKKWIKNSSAIDIGKKKLRDLRNEGETKKSDEEQDEAVFFSQIDQLESALVSFGSQSNEQEHLLVTTEKALHSTQKQKQSLQCQVEELLEIQSELIVFMREKDKSIHFLCAEILMLMKKFQALCEAADIDSEVIKNLQLEGLDFSMLKQGINKCLRIADYKKIHTGVVETEWLEQQPKEDKGNLNKEENAFLLGMEEINVTDEIRNEQMDNMKDSIRKNDRKRLIAEIEEKRRIEEELRGEIEKVQEEKVKAMESVRAVQTSPMVQKKFIPNLPIDPLATPDVINEIYCSIISQEGDQLGDGEVNKRRGLVGEHMEGREGDVLLVEKEQKEEIEEKRGVEKEGEEVELEDSSVELYDDTDSDSASEYSESEISYGIMSKPDASISASDYEIDIRNTPANS